MSTQIDEYVVYINFDQIQHDSYKTIIVVNDGILPEEFQPRDVKRVKIVNRIPPENRPPYSLVKIVNDGTISIGEAHEVVYVVNPEDLPVSMHVAAGNKMACPSCFSFLHQIGTITFLCQRCGASFDFYQLEAHYRATWT